MEPQIFYDTPDGRRTVVVTSGEAQGSILGPDLWKLSYDDILDIECQRTHSTWETRMSSRSFQRATLRTPGENEIKS